jgi:hypothetical protein
MTERTRDERIAANIRAALRLIKQGFSAHAEGLLQETLEIMENGQ